jgi:hypothetical protein
MATQTTPRHIETTETLLRLYVFLAQYLDRCGDESLRASFPEAELQKHLRATRGSMMEILAVNRVVKEKVTQECERVLALGESCLRKKDTALSDSLKAERAALQTKTIALSDLLAVFRAQL